MAVLLKLFILYALLTSATPVAVEMENFIAGKCKSGATDLVLWKTAYWQCLEECRSRTLCTSVSVNTKLGICRLNFDAELPVDDCASFVYSEKSGWKQRSLCTPSQCEAGENVKMMPDCSCAVEGCPRLAAPAFGKLLGNGRQVGQQVVYVCDSSHNALGNIRYRTCLEDGDWSGDPVTCAEPGLSTALTTKSRTTSSQPLYTEKPSTSSQPITTIKQTTPFQTRTTIKQTKPFQPLTTIKQTTPFQPMTTIKQTTPFQPLTTIKQTTPFQPMTTIKQTTRFQPLTTIKQTTPFQPMTTIKQTTPFQPLTTIEQTTPFQPMTTIKQTTPFQPLTTIEQTTPFQPLITTIKGITSTTPVSSPYKSTTSPWKQDTTTQPTPPWQPTTTTQPTSPWQPTTTTQPTSPWQPTTTTQPASTTEPASFHDLYLQACVEGDVCDTSEFYVECRRNTCQCLRTLIYDSSSGSCVTDCPYPAYGSTYQEYYNYVMLHGVDLTTNQETLARSTFSTSAEAVNYALEKCTNSDQCRAVQAIVTELDGSIITFTMYEGAVGLLDVEESTIKYKMNRLYLRDCQDTKETTYY